MASRNIHAGVAGTVCDVLCVPSLSVCWVCRKRGSDPSRHRPDKLSPPVKSQSVPHIARPLSIYLPPPLCHVRCTQEAGDTTSKAATNPRADLSRRGVCGCHHHHHHGSCFPYVHPRQLSRVCRKEATHPPTRPQPERCVRVSSPSPP